MRVKKLVGVFVALAITLTTAVIAVPSAAASAADEQFANRLYVLINDYRQQHGLAPLRLDPQMSADSQGWTQQSADIANTAGAGSFRHSPGSYAFHENIVWNMSADSAFQSWVDSAPHRANMLVAGATDIGIGAVELTAGPNRGTFLATAQFGWSKAPADAAAQAARLEAQRIAAEKSAADKAAADKAAADKAVADKAAADKAAADQAAADKAAADKAAADKAAADKAAADAANAAVPVPEESAATQPVQSETEQDKAAKDQAAQLAAQKAADEAAALKAAEDEAARQAELKAIAEAAAAEQVAADQAAATEAAEAAAVESAAAAAEAAAAQAAEAKAAEQAAASQSSAGMPAAARGISRELQNRATVLTQLDQVVLGNEALLTNAARGTITAKAAGSQLRITGLEPGSAVDTVIPSAGVNLGTVSADATGELKLSVPPVLAAGEHKVALFTDGGLTGWASFTVEPAVTVLAAQSVQAGAGVELAVTGLNPAQITIGGIGALMALIGAAVLIALQRQRGIRAR